eukprot:TRINITY_DN5717_c0_g1_i1.p1 TRINITY_DN5717_c0_g1~~TRINITY_DN5717_c0_g1_i1.p1  ORF type:complete len:894 (+),score=232.22 TRINITY_DN5717_c0_g1_i1:71-2752(+)
MSSDQLDKWFNEEQQVLTVDRGDGEPLGINIDSKMVISEVTEGSVGWNAGLRSGMKITAIEGKEIFRPESLANAMKEAGNKFELFVIIEALDDISEDYSSVMDDMSVAESTISLSEAGQLHTHTVTRSSLDQDFGFQFNDNLVITAVTPSGRAHAAGIDPNQHIFLVNNKPSTASELRQLLQSKTLSITFTMRPKRKETRRDALRRTLKSGTAGIGKKMASVLGTEGGATVTTLQTLNQMDGMVITGTEDAERIRREISSLRRQIADLDVRQKRAIAGSAEFKRRIESCQSTTDTLTSQHRHLAEILSKSKTADGRASLHNLVQAAEESQERQLMDFTTRQTDLKQELRSIKARNAELHEQATNSDIKVSTTSKEAELSGAEKEKQLEDLITDCKSKIKTTEKELETTKKKILLLKEVTLKTTSEVEEQRENKEFLIKQVNALKTENDASHEERRQLTLRIQSGAEALEETVEKLMEKVRAAGTDRDKHLAKASQELTRKQGQENELVKKQQELEDTLDQTKKSNRDLAKQNENFKAEEERHLLKIEELSKETHDLREVMSSCEAVEQEKAERSATLEASMKQLSQYESQQKVLKKEIHTLNKTVKERSNELAQANEASQELRAQLAQLEARLSELYPLSEELISIQSDISNYESHREVEESVVNNLNKQLSSQDEIYMSLKDKQRDLKDQIDTHEERVAFLHKEAESHTAVMADLIKTHQSALSELQHKSSVERRDVQQSILLLQSELKDTEKRYKYTAHKLQLFEQTLMQSESTEGGGTISSYASLKDENEKLCNAVSLIQDKLRKAEIDKRTAQATILHKQVEESKKDAMLSRYTGHTDPVSSPRRFLNKVVKRKAPSMQHVVEELMYENSKLKERNEQLRCEIAEFRNH